MIDLNDVVLFVEVVRHGSFAGAARHLNVPANTLSRRVQLLEDRIGARLMHRSTRHLSLTSAGEVFYERCAIQVDALAQASRELMDVSSEAGGLVRVAAPMDFFDCFRMSWVAEFLEQHPKVRFDFVLSDETDDLITSRIDLAFQAGTLTDSGYVGRQLILPSRNQLVASARYLHSFGLPSNLEDLRAHHAVSHPHASGYTHWRLSGDGDRDAMIKVPIRVSVNNTNSLRSAALEGMGIALLPLPTVKSDFESGGLVPVLPRYWSTGGGLNVLYPSRRHLPLAVSRFIDVVTERFSVRTGLVGVSQGTTGESLVA